jgi:ribosomal protein L28
MPQQPLQPPQPLQPLHPQMMQPQIVQPQVYRPAPMQYGYPTQHTTPPQVGIAARTGTTPFYGRTRAQAEAEGRLIDARAQDRTREATRNWQPNARPEEFFWVWSPERTVRMLLTFATIQTFDDGGVWHNDPVTDIAYYVRGTANSN